MSLVVLHHVDNHAVLAASATRIERGRFEALQSSAEVLRAAQIAAAELREDSEHLLETQKAEARDEGYQQGLADAMLAVMGTLETERLLRQVLADRMADVVEQCVRGMLGDIGPVEAFQRRARHLLRSTPNGARAILHVSPSQAPLAQALVAEQAAAAGGELGWLTVSSDEQCQSDALVLETRVGFIDASVDLTLAAARDLVSRAVQGAAARLGL
jgi:flagellar biosynthesis/type III secretory pathway protein FliH